MSCPWRGLCHLGVYFYPQRQGIWWNQRGVGFFVLFLSDWDYFNFHFKNYICSHSFQRTTYLWEENFMNQFIWQRKKFWRSKLTMTQSSNRTFSVPPIPLPRLSFSVLLLSLPKDNHHPDFKYHSLVLPIFQLFIKGIIHFIFFLHLASLAQCFICDSHNQVSCCGM